MYSLRYVAFPALAGAFTVVAEKATRWVAGWPGSCAAYRVAFQHDIVGLHIAAACPFSAPQGT